MEFFKSTLKDMEPTEKTSLVADWNNYSSGTDVESGSAGASTSTSTAAATGLASVTGFFSDSFKTITSTVTSTSTATTSALSFSIPTGQQLVYFSAFIGSGLFFLALAFTIFLPTIILSPSKFAFSFTLGCLLMMGGFTVLSGVEQQLKHMMSRERLPFSAGYLASVALTLYSALLLHNYILSLMASGLQVVALLYYILSYFPGGATGVRFVLGLFYNAALSCLGAAQRAVFAR